MHNLLLKFVSALLLLTLLLLLPRSNEAIVSNSSDKKVAFLFMSRGAMPLEDIWHEFFRWRANTSHYNIYNHVHRGYTFPASSFFSGKELSNESREPTDGSSTKHLWGNMGQVRAIRSLVKEALKDPLNEWFTLMSESCIPLYNFNVMRNALLKFDKSIINACPHMGIKEMEGDTRWRPGLDEVGFKLEHWRKSATWFALKRSHAQVFVDDLSVDRGWEKVPCCDEHFLPSILAMHHLDNETTCTDGFTHVHWNSVNDAHPVMYGADTITPDFFQHLNSDTSGFAGDSNPEMAKLGLSTCSGVPDMCHLMARKFSPASKYALLENIDLILADAEDEYEGNPWDHHQDKFRVNFTSTGTMQYFIIEHGFLRVIPDKETLASLHHMNVSDGKGIDIQTQTITPLDLTAYPIGVPMPSRKDGLLIKAPKNNQVYVIESGKRRGIPNMDTLAHLKLTLDDVKVYSDDDVQQIPLGFPIPDVNDPNKLHIEEKQRSRHRKKDGHKNGAQQQKIHELGDHGHDMTHNKEEIRKMQEKKLREIAEAAAAFAAASASGNITHGAAESGAGVHKWLYQDETTEI